MDNPISAPEVTQLLPCPFCGGEAELRGILSGQACCTVCDGNVCGEDREAAARAWNARHREESAAGYREALEKIASCEKRFDGDVVDIARNALHSGSAGK